MGMYTDYMSRLNYTQSLGARISATQVPAIGTQVLSHPSAYLRTPTRTSAQLVAAAKPGRASPSHTPTLPVRTARIRARITYHVSTHRGALCWPDPT